MGFDQLWNAFTASLPTLKDAWSTVIGLMILAALVGFGFSSLLGASAHKAKDQRIKLAEDRVADYKDKLEGKSPTEAADRIAQLEEAVALISPPVLAKEQAQLMTKELTKLRSDVRIDRDVSAASVDRAHRQMISIFGNAGWSVEDDIMLGDAEKPPSGLRLILRANMDEATVAAIRAALEAGGITYEEVSKPNESNVTVPQLLFSSPWEPARWG